MIYWVVVLSCFAYRTCLSSLQHFCNLFCICVRCVCVCLWVFVCLCMSHCSHQYSCHIKFCVFVSFLSLSLSLSVCLSVCLLILVSTCSPDYHLVLLLVDLLCVFMLHTYVHTHTYNGISVYTNMHAHIYVDTLQIDKADTHWVHRYTCTFLHIYRHSVVQ